MIRGTRTGAIPMVFAIALLDRQIIDAGEAPQHQPISAKLPILVTVGAEPIGGIVAPFIGETHGDSVAGEAPKLLDQPVIELARPLPGEKCDDRGAPLNEFGAVAPVAFH